MMYIGEACRACNSRGEISCGFRRRKPCPVCRGRGWKLSRMETHLDSCGRLSLDGDEWVLSTEEVKMLDLPWKPDEARPEDAA